MKYINVSIHDLTKSNLNQVRQLMKVLGEEGVENITLLIIPFYHYIESITEICDEIKQLTGRREIVLHGYTHLGLKFSALSYKRFFTSYEGEFVCFRDIAHRLQEGLQLLDGCGLKPSGFIPPAWLMRKEDFNTLKRFNIRFTTDRMYLYDLQTDKRHFSPVIAFSSRKLIQELSMLYVAGVNRLISNLKLLRIALHPPDVDSKTKMRLISSIIKRNSHRKYTTLSGYLDEINLTKNNQK